MIDTKKQYRTRDGREVRIYAVDGGGDWPVHGAVWERGEFCLRKWRATGEWLDNGKWAADDLIEVKPHIKRKVWVNVYPLHVGFRTYETKSAAISNMDHGCIACVEIDIDVEEGHGL